MTPQHKQTMETALKLVLEAIESLGGPPDQTHHVQAAIAELASAYEAEIEALEVRS